MHEFTARRPLVLVLALGCTMALAAAPADVALEQGRASFRAGALDDAAEQLERAVELAPGNAEAHHLLGATYGRQAATGSMFAKMRLAGKVKDHFERAVALAPDALEFRESLVQFYVQAPAIVGGGIDKARVQAAAIAERDAVRGELARATIARAEGKPEAVLQHVRAAQAGRPDDLRLALQVGLVLQELKRFDDAFAAFEAIVAKDPSAMGAWYQLGRTAVLADARHAEGEAALKRYLAARPGEQDPPHAAAHWRLGMLYELMAKAADARAQYESALRLDPEHAESKAALKRLR